MKKKFLFGTFYVLLFFTLSTFVHAQKNQNNYLDKIDYWKQESFNKKVKEVVTEFYEYYDDYGYGNQQKTLKKQTNTNQIFNKSGKLISQTEQAKTFIGSKIIKNYKKTFYEYDVNSHLIKERIYSSIDTLSLEPKDTAIYYSKIYNYDSKGILKECIEYNNSKKKVKNTVIIIDTIKNILEILQIENSSYPNNSKNKYQFDNNTLINQIHFNGSQATGKIMFTYDIKGQKIEEHYQAFNSHYESMKRIKYNKEGLIEELSRNSNIDQVNKIFYAYTFDKNKNWLTKEVKNDRGIVVENFTRKIFYFK